MKVVTFRKEDIFHTSTEIAVDVILERKVLRDMRLFWIEDLKIKHGTTGVKQILLGRHNYILQGRMILTHEGIFRKVETLLESHDYL